MIAILLATYNGARWLPEFLASLERQSFADWRLWVRDDGSTDETPSLIRRAAERDAKIELLIDTHGRRGPAGNFSLLMGEARRSSAKYFAFADQDDVWLPHKLELTLTTMRELETRTGDAMPLLVHTDLRVVDGRLQLIHPSHTEYAKICRHCPEDDLLRVVLAHNIVTGCACLMNRSLVDWAWPLPNEAVLHDWWVAVCAALAGKVQYIPEATVLYRQHGGNQVGAGGHFAVPRWRRARRTFTQSTIQARALLDRAYQRGFPLAERDKKLVERYANLSKGRAWRRSMETFKLHAGRPGVFDRLAYSAAAGLAVRQ